MQRKACEQQQQVWSMTDTNLRTAVNAIPTLHNQRLADELSGSADAEDAAAGVGCGT